MFPNAPQYIRTPWNPSGSRAVSYKVASKYGSYNRKRSGKNAPRDVSAKGKKFKKDYFAKHLSAMPQLFSEQLRYANVRNVAGLAVSTYTESTVVYMNSAVICDTTVGTPAIGYAKLIAMYSKCYVKGCRVTAKLTNLTLPTAPTALSWGLTITTNTTSLANYQQAISEGLCKYQKVGLSPDTSTLSITVDVSKFMSVKDLFAGSQFYSTNGAGPTQIVCAHIWVNNDGQTNAGSFTITYDVEYDCVFADPIPFT